MPRTMTAYLHDTRHAVETVFSGLEYEAGEILRLERLIEGLNREQASLGHIYRSLSQDPELDDEGIGTAAYWEGYENATRIENAEEEVTVLKQRVEDNEFAYASLAGALLQIAKQGLSVVHLELRYCPVGRQVAAVDLRDVIWESRNQSMHFEECRWNHYPSKKRVFDALSTQFPDLSPTGPKSCENLAAIVVNDVLQWRSYADYEADMTSLS